MRDRVAVGRLAWTTDVLIAAMRYDLHTHSHHSDGTLAPAELVRRAHAQGVDVLALTDHDVTDGLPEAAATATALQVGFIPGVEISVSWQNQTVHIVGLNIDAANASLQEGLARLREFRDWRAHEIDRRLAKKRVIGAYAGAARYARGKILSRTHFARFLVDQGFVRDMNQAFKHFLARGMPGYVPGRWAELAAAVRWITQAGGVAVLAHPARYKLNSRRLTLLLGEFRDCGGGAIEVAAGRHDADSARRFASVAQTHGLRASVGSDFHGIEGAWAELGRVPPLPEGSRPVWEVWSGASNVPETLSLGTVVPRSSTADSMC